MSGSRYSTQQDVLRAIRSERMGRPIDEGILIERQEPKTTL